MSDGGVMLLCAISNFGNLVIKVIESKYNSLKILMTYKSPLSCGVVDNLATLQKKVLEYLNYRIKWLF